MHLYKHRFTNETIEFVGLSNHDLTFRYLGEEFKEIFFSLSKEIVKRYYVEFPKNELAGDYIPEEGRYKARKITQFYPKIAWLPSHFDPAY